MRTVLIVVVQPMRQPSGALPRMAVSAAIRPLAKSGLNESLGFAVGLRAIGARTRATNVVSLASTGEVARGEYLAVIGEDTLNSHAESSIVGERLLQEAHGALRALGRPDLGKGDTRMIVNGHVGVIKSDAASALLTVAGDPMAYHPNAYQALDVQMQQFAWRRALVALRQRRGLERGQPTEPRTCQHPRYRGARNTQLGRNGRHGPAAPTQAN